MADFDFGDNIKIVSASATPPMFMTEAEIMNQEPLEYLIDGWLPQRGLTGLWGDSKTLKSFAGLDKAMCITHGIPWHGHVTLQGGVCYVAAEGAGGFGKRVRAWKQYHQTTTHPSPLYVRTAAVNLTDDAEVDMLIADLQKIERTAACKFKLIVWDTLARCMSGGEENSNTIMGQAIASADRVKNALDCAGLIIHHTGKTKENGPRGGSAFFAALDTGIFCTRDETGVKLKLDKQKDDVDGTAKRFRSEVIDLPVRKGKPQNSLVLIEKTPTAAPFAVPNMGLPVDTEYADLVSIATVLAPGQSYTVTDCAMAVFRNRTKATCDRVMNAVPETMINVRTDAGHAKQVRRIKANKTKGFIIECLKQSDPVVVD